MNRKGFTLIELLIVVVIIGILAAIAIPKFANTKEKAVVASMKSDLRNMVTANEGFFSDNNDYAGNFGPAQINGLAGAGTVAFSPTTGNVLTPELCRRSWLECDDHQSRRYQRVQRRVRHLRGRSRHVCRWRRSGRDGH